MQAYGYKYDNLNRIEEANYHENALSTSSTKYQLRIHEYDKNGNIKRLDRRNGNGDLMDQLTYDYTAMGNQLKSVTDNGEIAEGFVDGNTTAVDYNYDDNGNMISDANKNISTFDYNMLNLPELITFNDGKQIKYIYDASGMKLRKEAYENELLVKSINYVGALIEENDELQFVQTSEGRIVPKVMNNQSVNEYQYHLKDHLGNVRTTFAVKDEYLTTSFETNDEIDFIGSYENIIRENKAFSRTGDYVHKLTGGNEENVVGLMKTLKVTKGDKVSAEVYGTYLAGEEAGGNLNLGTIVGAVVNALSGGGSGLEGMNDQDLINNGFNAAALGDDDNSNHPNAYLNFVLLDENYQYVTEASGFQRLDANATTDGSNTAEFDHLYFEDITIPEDGYLLVYVSNESQNVTEVYWDDFTIRHQYNDVVQKDDYYPFGLTFNDYQKNVSIENNYKYNGVEKQYSTDWVDYGARMYMPEIGRWNGIDLMIDNHQDYTPYAYVYNNPILYTDDFGLDTLLVNRQGEISEKVLEGGDKDVIVRVNDREFEDGEIRYKKDGTLKKRHEVSDGYEKGSIEVRSRSNGTYIETSNEQSKSVFNFLADNTNVEFSRIEFKENGEINNMITTSHSHLSDQLGTNYTRSIAEGVNLLLSHTHNHPRDNFYYPSTPANTAVPGSTGDTGAYKIWLDKNGDDFKVYVRFRGITRRFDYDGKKLTNK